MASTSTFSTKRYRKGQRRVTPTNKLHSGWKVNPVTRKKWKGKQADSMEKDDVVSFKWDEQPMHLHQALSRLYRDLEGDQMLADVTLVSFEGEIVQAHSIVLTMCSPYFQRLFTKIQRLKRSPGGNGGTVIVLENAKISTLRSLLRYIYTGVVDIPSRQVEELVSLGKLMGIEGLERKTKSKSQSQNAPGSLYSFRKRSLEKVSYQEDREEEHLLEELDDEFQTFDDTSETGTGGEESSKVKIERPDPDPNHSSFSVEGDGKDSFCEYGDGEESNFPPEDHNNDDNVEHLEEEEDNAEDQDQEYRPGYRIMPLGDKRRFQKMNWTEIPTPSEAEIQRDWRVSLTRPRFIQYYCVYGRRNCTARMKQDGLPDNPKFFSNGLPHTNHKRGIGMGYKNRLFVHELLKKGIIEPEEILQAMIKANLEVPEIKQIHSFLKHWRDKLRKSGYQVVLPKQKEEPRLNPKTGKLEKKRKRRDKDPPCTSTSSHLPSETSIGINLSSEPIQSTSTFVPHPPPEEQDPNQEIGLVPPGLVSESQNSSANPTSSSSLPFIPAQHYWTRF